MRIEAGREFSEREVTGIRKWYAFRIDNIIENLKKLCNKIIDEKEQFKLIMNIFVAY